MATDLSQLSLKLSQLLSQLTALTSQLYHYSSNTPQPSTANPGIPPYADLVQRYGLLMSQIAGLGGVLSGKDGRGIKEREKWENTVILPGDNIEEGKDWIVGVLLRTKQTPEVEQHLADLVTNLPPIFASDAPSYDSDALPSRNALMTACLERVQKLKKAASAEEGEGEDEWDWKARMPPGEGASEDEEGEDEGEMEVEKPEGSGEAAVNGGRAWTAKEVVAFQRTGRMPVLV